MEITVKVTASELEEFRFSGSDVLKACIIEDLDYDREYPGFNVTVIVVAEGE